jgi:hypothetical protein
VSDLTTVLSKVTVPLVVLPLLSFAILIVTQLLMLLLSSAVVLGRGVSVATLWRESSFIHFSMMLFYHLFSMMLFYHLVTVHGLWYAPFYGWFLLVSAWSPRAPFIWAFLPPFVILAVEKMAFNSSHFLAMLVNRLTGPEPSTKPVDDTLMAAMQAMGPLAIFQPARPVDRPGHRRGIPGSSHSSAPLSWPHLIRSVWALSTLPSHSRGGCATRFSAGNHQKSLDIHTISC